MNPTIKAVFFDFDGTLGNREKYAYECVREILKEVVDVKDPIEFEAIVQDWMLWDEQGNIKKKHIWEMLENKYGIVLPKEAPDRYWDARLWKYTVLFDDAMDTLNYLKEKYILGIITNGPSDGQRNKVKQSGVDQIIPMENVIVSGDYPFAKPDPRIFLEACHKLGVKPEESVYVGDIYANDVLGSYRAKMNPIWIWTLGNRAQNTDIPMIHSLSELKNLL